MIYSLTFEKMNELWIICEALVSRKEVVQVRVLFVSFIFLASFLETWFVRFIDFLQLFYALLYFSWAHS